MEKFLDIIFPTECVSCKKPGSPFCYSCCENCETVEDESCLICQQPSIDGCTHELCKNGLFVPSRFHSVFLYQGIARECIRSSKYGSREFAALKNLTRHGVKIFSKRSPELKIDFIVPVPISRAKHFERGFNHSLIIANILSKELKVPVLSRGVFRVKNTLPQAGLTKQQRYNNVLGAFKCTISLESKSILIVDDICTTGATLISLSKTLYSSGAKDICCFTLAKRL